MWCRILSVVFALFAASAAHAQSAPPSQGPDTPPVCAACPKRSPGRALFQTTMVNVFYEMANLVRGQVTARITPLVRKPTLLARAS